MVTESWAYGLNAYAFGGGTRLWQGMAWRFFPEDFEMARLYGNPEGATLADWPIDYDELEPYYTLAEWELGVAGEEGALTARTPRSKGYPMPAMGTEPARELLAGAAERLGWTWGAIPLAINSVPGNRPGGLRALLVMRRARLPGGRQEWCSQHLPPEGTGHRQCRDRLRRRGHRRP